MNNRTRLAPRRHLVHRGRLKVANLLRNLVLRHRKLRAVKVRNRAALLVEHDNIEHHQPRVELERRHRHLHLHCLIGLLRGRTTNATGQ